MERGIAVDIDVSVWFTEIGSKGEVLLSEGKGEKVFVAVFARAAGDGWRKGYWAMYPRGCSVYVRMGGGKTTTLW